MIIRTLAGGVNILLSLSFCRHTSKNVTALCNTELSFDKNDYFLRLL